MVDAVDSLAIKSKQKFWAKRKTLDNQLAVGSVLLYQC